MPEEDIWLLQARFDAFGSSEMQHLLEEWGKLRNKFHEEADTLARMQADWQRPGYVETEESPRPTTQWPLVMHARQRVRDKLNEIKRRSNEELRGKAAVSGIIALVGENESGDVIINAPTATATASALSPEISAEVRWGPVSLAVFFAFAGVVIGSTAPLISYGGLGWIIADAVVWPVVMLAVFFVQPIRRRVVLFIIRRIPGLPT